jgi:hypothetical protein
MATTAVEKPKTRSDLAQLAGKGPFSFIAILAGVLVGYATFALLLGGTAAILHGNDSRLNLSENWSDLSATGGLLLGGLLFASYLLASYIAGRMAWRRGAMHGVLVVVGSILVVGLAGLLLRALTQPGDVEGITDALKSFGVPTTLDEWGNVGPVVWVASVCGMLLGSVVGGLLGERWFTRVSRGAIDAELDIRERMEASNERLASMEPARRDGDNGHNKDEVVELDSLNKEELYQLAQEEDIPGRSQMTKEQLAEALREQGTLQKH